MNGKPGTCRCTTPIWTPYDTLTDVLKGSYYANPIIDTPDVSDEDRKAYPEYHGSNICLYTILFLAKMLNASLQGPPPTRKALRASRKHLKTWAGTDMLVTQVAKLSSHAYPSDSSSMLDASWLPLASHSVSWAVIL